MGADMERIRNQHYRAKTICSHCGNESHKELSGVDNQILDNNGQVRQHRLYRCEICDGIILQRVTGKVGNMFTEGFVTLIVSEGALEENVQVWPASLALPEVVAERVRRVYEEALLVKRNSPSSFVVQIRRALEALASDQGAPGKTLSERLSALVKNGVLPESIGELAHANRLFGNWGAHDAEVDVDHEDAQIVDGIFRAIVEYVYVAPAQLSAVRSLIARKRVT